MRNQYQILEEIQAAANWDLVAILPRWTLAWVSLAHKRVLMITSSIALFDQGGLAATQLARMLKEHLGLVLADFFKNDYVV